LVVGSLEGVDMSGQGKPLHVCVDEILFGTPTEIGYPQNIAQVSDDAPFPTGQPEAVWYRRWFLQPDHDCVYAWNNEPCECQTTGLTRIPRYDLDWSATGPLIERFGIDLIHTSWGWEASRVVDGTLVSATDIVTHTALGAVCNLILALHAAGKPLKAQP
jgi:hypothetical protein